MGFTLTFTMTQSGFMFFSNQQSSRSDVTQILTPVPLLFLLCLKQDPRGRKLKWGAVFSFCESNRSQHFYGAHSEPAQCWPCFIDEETEAWRGQGTFLLSIIHLDFRKSELPHSLTASLFIQQHAISISLLQVFYPN